MKKFFGLLLVSAAIAVSLSCVGASPPSGSARKLALETEKPLPAASDSKLSAAPNSPSKPESRESAPSLPRKESIRGQLDNAFCHWTSAISEMGQLETRFLETVKDKPEESALKEQIKGFSGTLHYHELCSEYRLAKNRLELLRVEISKLLKLYHEEHLLDYTPNQVLADSAEALDHPPSSAAQVAEPTELPEVIKEMLAVEQEALLKPSIPQNDIRNVSLRFASADLSSCLSDWKAIDSALESRLQQLSCLAGRVGPAQDSASLEEGLQQSSANLEREQLEFVARLLLSAEKEKHQEIESFLKLAAEAPCQKIETWLSTKVLAKNP